MTIYSWYGSINSHTTLLSKSYASSLHARLQKRESLSKCIYLWGRRFSQPYLRGRTQCSQKLRLWTLCM